MTTEVPTIALDRLEQLLREGMERWRVPGVAVGLLAGGVEHTLCAGVTSVENPLPVTADTLFQIGSTTKTLTATAALRLVEQGRLDLDAPVRGYLPELALADEGVAARVTTRHLFNHTGGWVGDVFVDTGAGDDALARVVALLRERPQITPLGALWSYNNAAFYIAGRLIEVLTGASYEAAVRDLLLDPLGMRDSFFFPAEVMLRRFAVGHVDGPDGPRVARPWGLPRAAYPAGGLASSARDQLRYARFQIGDGAAEGGARLLRPATLRAMQAPALRGPRRAMFGISWFIHEIGGVRFLAHGGSTNGQMSEFWLAPERGVAWTVLTNGSEGHQLGDMVTRWVREQVLGVVEPELAPIDAPRERLAAYVGHYDGAANGAALDVELDDGGLLLRVTPGTVPGLFETPPPPPPMRLALCADEQALVTDGDRQGAVGEFLRDDAGRLAWLRWGYRLFARR